jgi:hemoglobin
MADFWSSVMLTSGRYHGNPVAAHLKHRDAITPGLFERWLALWTQTASEILPAPDAQAVIAKAQRIAESLQLALFFRLPLRHPSRLTPIYSPAKDVYPC